MAQLAYRDADEMPADLRKKIFRDRDGQRWHVVALVIHHDPESGKERNRTAFLRRVDSGGREWEIPLTGLYETAEVER
ncbi:hypothetical protein [Streptomyces sp. NPDC048623]|uniref:hypothetical protein n=1 Tax=Streptomyces sp. NPDC048623 TaxID=3155761 RepID=UPI00343ADD6A